MGQRFLRQGTIVHAEDEILVLTSNPFLRNKANTAFVLVCVVLLFSTKSHCTVNFYLNFIVQEMTADY